MSAHYKRFMKLLEKWPIDKSRSGRDLGEHLRKQFKSVISLETLNPEASEKFERQLGALDRIANNTYGKKYTRENTSAATGLTAEQCSQVLSSEFLQYLNKDKGK